MQNNEYKNSVKCLASGTHLTYVAGSDDYSGLTPGNATEAYDPAYPVYFGTVYPAFGGGSGGINSLGVNKSY